MIGDLQLHPDGFGFVVGEGEGADVFIPRRAMGGAMHRDRVEVEYGPSAPRQPRRSERNAPPKKERPQSLEGRIVKIVSRGTQQIVGRFATVPRGPAQVISDDARIPQRIEIPADATGGARHGQTVVVRLLSYSDSPTGLRGKVVRILGARGHLETEIETVIHHHELPIDFPEAIETAASNIRARGTGAPSAHRDCRALPLVTIDGETAKDFDDAVAVVATPQGGYQIWIGIADVSHYVLPGSDIDQEALARATSVYFPDRVLPMLPHTLSDDLCSLRPEEDRCALIAELHCSAKGVVTHTDFYPGIMTSRARLTYTAVHQIVTVRNPSTREAHRVLCPMLDLMAQLCQQLRTQRRQRGSIDFDLPEPEIVLDMEGGPEAIIKAERYFAHQMIEELMIAANEAVARFLTSHGVPCLFRVHPAPEPGKMRDLALLLSHIGIPFQPTIPVQSHALARVVEAVRGHPAERLVNHTLLRSMQQAVYDPKNDGHFGLASRCYCHFTSPIRRYPDLVNHRLLKAVLRGDRPPMTPPQALAIARQCSQRERVAMAAEREMAKVYAADFLRSRVGEAFAGIIAHVTKHGFYVELQEYFVEGFVSKISLTDDRYQFDEGHIRLVGQRSKRSYEIGSAVRVVVEEIHIETREIRFRCAEE